MRSQRVRVRRIYPVPGEVPKGDRRHVRAVRCQERERRNVADDQRGLQLAQQHRLAGRHVVERGGVCSRAPNRLEGVETQAIDLDDARVALGWQPPDWRSQRQIEQPSRRGCADDEAHARRDCVQRVEDLDIP